MKKVFALLLASVMLFALVACGGNDSVDGTWVPVSGQSGGFASITFDGNNVSIPPITIMSDTPGTGMSTTFSITGGEIILTQSGQGVSQEIGRFSFSRDGDSIFIADVEYERQN